MKKLLRREVWDGTHGVNKVFKPISTSNSYLFSSLHGELTPYYHHHPVCVPKELAEKFPPEVWGLVESSVLSLLLPQMRVFDAGTPTSSYL